MIIYSVENVIIFSVVIFSRKSYSVVILMCQEKSKAKLAPYGLFVAPSTVYENYILVKASFEYRT